MEDEDYIKALAAQGGDIQDIYSLLQRSRSLPTSSFSLQNNVSNAEYSPSTNNVNFNPTTGLNARTVPHEYTHALDHVFGNLYSNISKKLQLDPSLVSPQERRFYDGYTKMMVQPTALPKDPHDTYRNTGPELRAFGVGNSAIPGPTEYALPHTDASMAQEEAIMRELYSRTLNRRTQR